MELYLSDFLSLAIAHFVALLSPGVDFFLILTNSLKYGKKAGILTSIGISLANLFYILLSFLGISLIKDNIFIFTLLKILGSIYLIYIGYSLINSKKTELFSITIKKEKIKKYALKYFSMGFLSAILNPKNSIFYFTMFSISIQHNTPFLMQGFYAIWMFLAVLFWDIFIVYLVTNKQSIVFLDKYSNILEKVSGIILCLIGISIMYNLFY